MGTKTSDLSILDLAAGYWSAKTFLSAVELGLFGVLGDGGKTEPEIRETLGLHPRSSRDFLDSLVALKVLDRDAEGRYTISPAAANQLDPKHPSYQGGFLRMHAWQYGVWGKLTDLLKTGDMQAHTDRDFNKFYSRPESVRNFMSAMDGANAAVGPALAEKFDWTEVTSFVDVGGARGNIAAVIAKAHPHLTAGTFDLPPVAPFFAEHMDRLGMTDRVHFHPGDFFNDSLPTADVLIFGHVLHDWNDEQRVALLRKAYEALPAGGRVMVYDALIDDDRREPANLLLSLNMQLVTPGGGEYTGADCQGWMREAGFTETSVLPLTDADSAVIGRKAA